MILTCASRETRPSTKPVTMSVTTGLPLTPPSPTAWRTTRKPGLAAAGARAVAAAGSTSTARTAQLTRNRRMALPAYCAREEGRIISRSSVVMTDDRLQRRADGLAARVEALALALKASRASEEASAELLSHASAAVLQAVRLDLMVERPPRLAV